MCLLRLTSRVFIVHLVGLFGDTSLTFFYVNVIVLDETVPEPWIFRLCYPAQPRMNLQIAPKQLQAWLIAP